MGLFGSSKDDTRAKIEELKAKMQGGGQQQQQPPQQQQQQQGAPQQAWQQQPPQEQGWQPPREQQAPQPPQQQQQRSAPTTTSSSHTHETDGILLELGEGMSLNLPIKEKMRLDEFLRIADRVRELKKIDHS